jgi:1,4-alpha-glucan branching enzyme
MSRPPKLFPAGGQEGDDLPERPARPQKPTSERYAHFERGADARLYEIHIGASSESTMGTYASVSDHLPRIVEGGYTTIQL